MLPNLCLVKSKPKNSRILQIESKFLKAIEKISPNAVKSAQERIDLINLIGSSKKYDCDLFDRLRNSNLKFPNQP